MSTLGRAVIALALAVACVGCGGPPPLPEPDRYNPYSSDFGEPHEFARRLLDDGRFDDALLVIDRWAHVVSPVHAAVIRGRALLGKGKYADAADQYRSAIEDEAFWEDDTWIAEEQRHIGLTVMADRKTMELARRLYDPGWWRAQDLLRAGEAFLRAGSPREARQACEYLDELGYGSDPNMLMLQAESSFQLGHYLEARAAYSVALRSMDSEHARRRIAAIDSLTKRQER